MKLAQLARSFFVVAKPEGRANSFVGTEDYLAPEIITGDGQWRGGCAAELGRAGLRVQLAGGCRSSCCV